MSVPIMRQWVDLTEIRAVQLKAGAGWYARVTLPHGAQTHINCFKTERKHENGLAKNPSNGSRSTEEADMSRSPTHKPEPYSDGGEFGEGEVVGVVLFVARRHRAEMLKFVEEAFDEITEG